MTQVQKVNFTPTEEIENELVGFVDAIEATTRYGSKLAFKFVVNNGEGVRVQVSAWNDEVTRAEQNVHIDHIVHFDSARAVVSSPFNRSNYFGAELTIQTYTSIQDLKKMDRTIY
ncbi:hypothetical protein KQX54_012888 [Cotesia glomerata]|uniref:Uncharacterized protein n=1 Tax=Cotesia glomerata TaxID=32391 RepID=A0AAV7IF27_COTGL|nr:hypothetical protein KQX54_012888 [Cotesia glomerata]